MNWIAPIAAAVITALGAGMLSRLRLSDRLRLRAKAELDILEKLPPDTAAHRALVEHIERQVFLMVAEEEPLTARERMDRRWGYFWYAIAAGFLLPALAMKPPSAFVLGASAALVGSYGFLRTARTERAREARRLEKSLEADPPPGRLPRRTEVDVARDLLLSLRTRRRSG